MKYTRWYKLHASCHSKFVVHEVMNCVANLKVHLRVYTLNVNICVYTGTILNDKTPYVHTCDSPSSITFEHFLSVMVNRRAVMFGHCDTRVC